MKPVIEKDGRLFVTPNFMADEEALQCAELLLAELSWSAESIRIFGRSVVSPRLVSWYGEPEAIYTYSGVVHYPLSWHPVLLRIKKRLEAHVGASFNSVLCNWYRDGNDSMGWHADTEKELGAEPTIGSLSLGDIRTFQIRHRNSGETHQIEMSNGSLIVMEGRLQQFWRHCVPKTRKAVRARVNLSFRNIVADQGASNPANRSE